MNSFANSLFTLLFGWARGLIQRVWTSAASGRYSGFFVWLGDHWAWLAVLLCVGCTVMDFLIWLVRWRPYLVWRTALHRLVRRFHGDQTENARRFERGYQGGVTLDMPQTEEAGPAPSDWEEAADAETPDAWQTASVMNTFTQAVVNPPPEYAWNAAEAQYAQNEEDAGQETWQRRFAPPAGYEVPAMTATARVNSAYAAELPTGRRRRRSEKYERRRAEWRERLIKGDEDEDALLDGLPPAVDRQQAFHEPVYPQSGGGSSGYSVWQRPVSGGNETNGNRA
ncbi:MAG: hypothetical protein Q4G00_11200 [Clostridia bacterium]|nr:hypothetical protein [Clostridia bacterium]